LLVIGDTIVDNYVACDAVGMSAEAPVLVVKELENREFIGGAAIVASHVRALGAKCHYISVVGDDLLSNSVKEVLNDRDIDMSLIIDPSRPTTYKTRYMVENQKLFRVSRIKDHKISEKIENEVINKLNDLAPDIDGIMVSDFVYGIITPNILTEILHLAKKFNLKLFGDLQCSSQVGKVTKFNKFDLITPTEKEARVALSDNESGIEWIANTLLENTGSKNMLMKLGSDGFIAYSDHNLGNRQNFPALTANPVDVTGAGDSLFAVMSVSLVSNASLMEASAIGACMSSLAVQEVGNIPITKDKLDKYIVDILG
jgi:rfaE bifunctional protein kinase chain/domain